tara:strand:- start:33 stop:209 length:177 start_codon:yes stop_codon:yes gene_type:complete
MAELLELMHVSIAFTALSMSATTAILAPGVDLPDHTPLMESLVYDQELKTQREGNLPK